MVRTSRVNVSLSNLPVDPATKKHSLDRRTALALHARGGQSIECRYLDFQKPVGRISKTSHDSPALM
ncbi:hypothetical protein EMPG_17524 [Blastomyces silverae]|uniref:Uncharacterized protein n=1 Tax=Blastomyces silverae TaxID=2060906 RepID=A0A0H1B7C0_9EURO|nr:hypothetical protein EMPG_17524 [Blastomyces silverae]